MRLIDADELKSVFTEKSTEAVCGAELCKAIISRIDDTPTIDAVPVRRGKWFIGTVPYFVCSECKNRTPLKWDERRGYVLDYRSPYCPNCGARMDAERKEE